MPRCLLMTCLAAVASLCAIVPMTARAQPVAWAQQMVSGPSARYQSAMVYDSARGVTVLFGGFENNLGHNNETWEWNGTAWTRRMVGGPSPRLEHAMAYDAARGVTVLFGGQLANGSISDETWEWNGNGGGTWTQRMVSGPSLRQKHAMAYDSARGVTVLFGGIANNVFNGETWEWNGNGGGAWTQRMVSGPSGRLKHAMAYDAGRGVTVLFGGTPNGFIGTDETWEWNGAGAGTWTQRMASAPTARYGHSMAYDAARGVTVLFGGYNAGLISSDTWEWNGIGGGGGGAWTQRMITGPSPRYYQAMAFDAARGVPVLFGGLVNNNVNGETWVLNPPCVALNITAQPAARTACSTGSASFTVAASGTGPFSYQWQVQTAPGVWQSMGNDPGPLPCGGGGAFSYASPINSPSVNIGIRPCPGNPTSPQHFQIRVVVTNACGSVTSNEATYTICPADFNCSGTLSVQDIFDFLNAWFALDPRANFNGANNITVSDIFDYLDAWFTGC